MNTIGTRRVLTFGFLATFVLVSGGCAFDQLKSEHTSGGVIRDVVAAKTIARAMWVSMNPSLKVLSADDWQEKVDAHLDGNVWRVYERSIAHGAIGGKWEIDLDARDGKLLRVFMSQ